MQTSKVALRNSFLRGSGRFKRQQKENGNQVRLNGFVAVKGLFRMS